MSEDDVDRGDERGVNRGRGWDMDEGNRSRRDDRGLERVGFGEE